MLGVTQTGKQRQAIWLSSRSSSRAHACPAGQSPPHVGAESPQPPGSVVVVVVVLAAKQSFVHAPQQLGQTPTVPPEPVHAAALFRILHRGSPRTVLQHVTLPGRPHRERDAQRRASRTHSGRRLPLATAVSMRWRAHAM
jgi:hypothetical protein